MDDAFSPKRLRSHFSLTPDLQPSTGIMDIDFEHVEYFLCQQNRAYPRPTYIGIGRLVDHQIMSSVSSSVHRIDTPCISRLFCVTKVPCILVPKRKILFTMTGGGYM
jgi:hypothetical protein